MTIIWFIYYCWSCFVFYFFFFRNAQNFRLKTLTRLLYSVYTTTRVTNEYKAITINTNCSFCLRTSSLTRWNYSMHIVAVVRSSIAGCRHFSRRYDFYAFNFGLQTFRTHCMHLYVKRFFLAVTIDRFVRYGRSTIRVCSKTMYLLKKKKNNCNIIILQSIAVPAVWYVPSIL